MICDDAAFDHDSDADFQRWYFGGSPPESECWPRHAFQDALRGAAPAADRSGVRAPIVAEPVESASPAQFAMA